MSLLRTFFGGGKRIAGSAGSAIDVVTYVASLASDMKAIDPLLDPLREITSRLQPGQTLGAADQAVLADVCRKLQAYLVERDPLRSVTKATLETKIGQKFPIPSPGETAFWEQLRLR